MIHIPNILPDKRVFLLAKTYCTEATGSMTTPFMSFEANELDEANKKLLELEKFNKIIGYIEGYKTYSTTPFEDAKLISVFNFSFNENEDIYFMNQDNLQDPFYVKFSREKDKNEILYSQKTNLKSFLIETHIFDNNLFCDCEEHFEILEV